MFTPTEIKYRPDGSIDTDHHMRQGRAARSKAAHELAKRMISPPKLERPSLRLGWPRLLRLE